MQSETFGPHNHECSVTNGSLKYHKSMLKAFFIEPFLHSVKGIFEHIYIKTILGLTALPALLAFELFNTPSLWWKGLLWLVVLDWLSGVITAIYNKEFDWNIAISKWYQVASYTIICASASIVANTFGGYFSYFQYVVYATLFLKEFVSILKTFNVLSLIQITHAFIVSDKGESGIREFIKYLNEQNKKKE